MHLKYSILRALGAAFVLSAQALGVMPEAERQSIVQELAQLPLEAAKEIRLGNMTVRISFERLLTAFLTRSPEGVVTTAHFHIRSDGETHTFSWESGTQENRRALAAINRFLDQKTLPDDHVLTIEEDSVTAGHSRFKLDLAFKDGTPRLIKLVHTDKLGRIRRDNSGNFRLEGGSNSKFSIVTEMGLTYVGDIWTGTISRAASGTPEEIAPLRKIQKRLSTEYAAPSAPEKEAALNFLSKLTKTGPDALQNEVRRSANTLSLKLKVDGNDVVVMRRVDPITKAITFFLPGDHGLGAGLRTIDAKNTTHFQQLENWFEPISHAAKNFESLARAGSLAYDLHTPEMSGFSLDWELIQGRLIITNAFYTTHHGRLPNPLLIDSFTFDSLSGDVVMQTIRGEIHFYFGDTIDKQDKCRLMRGQVAYEGMLTMTGSYAREMFTTGDRIYLSGHPGQIGLGEYTQLKCWAHLTPNADQIGDLLLRVLQ